MRLLSTLLSVDAEVWTEEAALIPPFYERFAERMPKALWNQHAALVPRLQSAESSRPGAA